MARVLLKALIFARSLGKRLHSRRARGLRAPVGSLPDEGSCLGQLAA